jgi:hypothetical protein
VQPQTPNQVRLIVEVYVDEDLLVHLGPCSVTDWLGLVDSPGADFNTLWQTLFFEREADLVRFRAGELAKLVNHPKREQDCGIGAYRNTRISLFNLYQGRTGDEGALGHDRDRNAAPQPRVPDVGSEFAQGAFDWDG